MTGRIITDPGYIKQRGDIHLKKIIPHLKEDWQAFIFALIGLLLAVFPAHVAKGAPYIIGVSSLLYALVDIIISLKYPDAKTTLGKSVIFAVTGIVILLLKGESISVIGIIWAMNSLQDIAGEIDEYYKTKEISLVKVIGIIISMILAALLMLDPFEHFNMHIRILGLEMITTVFIRKRMRVSKE